MINMLKIELTKADRFDTRYHGKYFVDPVQIESVAHCTVGERADGAIIRTLSGDTVRVWESVDQVQRRIAAAFEAAT